MISCREAECVHYFKKLFYAYDTPFYRMLEAVFPVQCFRLHAVSWNLLPQKAQDSNECRQ